MVGIVKKFDPQGFGIIESVGGTKLPFVLSDFARNLIPREGLRVTFSIRNVKGKFFASHVFTQRAASNAV
jgi:cold shock CspA family protein